MASEDPGPTVIRNPVPDDEGAWRNLWAGYCAFYETKVPEAVTAATWATMLTPGSQLFGRLAEWKGEVAGFTISVLHARTWTLAPICYVEDLFVTPEARGHGIGCALIEDLLAMGRVSTGTRGKETRQLGASTTSSRQRTISSATA